MASDEIKYKLHFEHIEEPGFWRGVAQRRRRRNEAKRRRLAEVAADGVAILSVVIGRQLYRLTTRRRP